MPKKDDTLLSLLLAEVKALREEQAEILENLDLLEKPLWIQDGNKKKLLRPSEITFITSNSKGLDIYTTTGQKYVNFGSIGQTTDDLSADSRIMRTHKSFIVNLTQIDTVTVIPGGRVLTFKNFDPKITAKVGFEFLREFEFKLGKE